MNITKEGDEIIRMNKLTKEQIELEKLRLYLHDNPCDNCSMKYIDPNACLTCDINFE